LRRRGSAGRDRRVTAGYVQGIAVPQVACIAVLTAAHRVRPGGHRWRGSCVHAWPTVSRLSPHSPQSPPMYLVEIETGREALYDSVDALRVAIRCGEVGPQSRIYHRASSSWISITLHPEFRRAAAARGGEPLPPLARSQWTFFGVEPKGREIHEPPATERAAKQTTADTTNERRAGLRGLLGRAWRSLAPSARTSETSNS